MANGRIGGLGIRYANECSHKDAQFNQPLVCVCVRVSVQESGRWVKGGLTHQKHRALDFMPLAHSC